MAQNQFKDPATGSVYVWHANHKEEAGGARIRAISNMQPTMGRWKTCRAVRQQGTRDELVLKLSGRAVNLAQHLAFLHFQDLSLHQTIIFVHAAGGSIECQLSDYEPLRVWLPRGPAGEQNVWDYTMQLDTIE